MSNEEFIKWLNQEATKPEEWSLEIITPDVSKVIHKRTGIYVLTSRMLWGRYPVVATIDGLNVCIAHVSSMETYGLIRELDKLSLAPRAAAERFLADFEG